MRIKENFLGSARTYLFDKQYDTKSFFQTIRVTSETRNVKIVNMFNSFKLTPIRTRMQGNTGLINGEPQYVMVDWGDGARTVYKNQLISVDSGKFNNGTGIKIQHTYANDGEYQVRIMSVEDLVVVEDTFDYVEFCKRKYDNNYNIVDKLKLETIAIGGKIRKYVGVNGLINKDDYLESLYIEEDIFSNSKIRRDFKLTSFIMRVDTIVNLSSDLIIMDTYEQMDFSGLFSNWSSFNKDVSTQDFNKNFMLMNRFLMNTFHQNIYGLDLSFFFAKSDEIAAYYSDISTFITKFLFNKQYFKNTIYDNKFESFEFMYWCSECYKPFYAFEYGLQFLELNKALPHKTNLIRGMFGNVKGYFSKPFDFRYLFYDQNTKNFENERGVIKNLNMSYFLYNSRCEITAFPNWGKVKNIFHIDTNDYEIGFDLTAAFGRSELNHFVTFEYHPMFENLYENSDEVYGIIPIPEVSDMLKGKYRYVKLLFDRVFTGTYNYISRGVTATPITSTQDYITRVRQGNDSPNLLTLTSPKFYIFKGASTAAVGFSNNNVTINVSMLQAMSSFEYIGNKKLYIKHGPTKYSLELIEPAKENITLACDINITQNYKEFFYNFHDPVNRCHDIAIGDINKLNMFLDYNLSIPDSTTKTITSNIDYTRALSCVSIFPINVFTRAQLNSFTVEPVGLQTRWFNPTDIRNSDKLNRNVISSNVDMTEVCAHSNTLACEMVLKSLSYNKPVDIFNSSTPVNKGRLMLMDESILDHRTLTKITSLNRAFSLSDYRAKLTGDSGALLGTKYYSLDLYMSDHSEVPHNDHYHDLHIDETIFSKFNFSKGVCNISKLFQNRIDIKFIDRFPLNNLFVIDFRNTIQADRMLEIEHTCYWYNEERDKYQNHYNVEGSNSIMNRAKDSRLFDFFKIFFIDHSKVLSGGFLFGLKGNKEINIESIFNGRFLPIEQHKAMYSFDRDILHKDTYTDGLKYIDCGEYYEGFGVDVPLKDKKTIALYVGGKVISIWENNPGYENYNRGYFHSVHNMLGESKAIKSIVTEYYMDSTWKLTDGTCYITPSMTAYNGIIKSSIVNRDVTYKHTTTLMYDQQVINHTSTDGVSKYPNGVIIETRVYNTVLDNAQEFKPVIKVTLADDSLCDESIISSSITKAKLFNNINTDKTPFYYLFKTNDNISFISANNIMDTQGYISNHVIESGTVELNSNAIVSSKRIAVRDLFDMLITNRQYMNDLGSVPMLYIAGLANNPKLLSLRDHDLKFVSAFSYVEQASPIFKNLKVIGGYGLLHREDVGNHPLLKAVSDKTSRMQILNDVHSLEMVNGTLVSNPKKIQVGLSNNLTANHDSNVIRLDILNINSGTHGTSICSFNPNFLTNISSLSYKDDCVSNIDINFGKNLIVDHETYITNLNEMGYKTIVSNYMAAYRNSAVSNIAESEYNNLKAYVLKLSDITDESDLIINVGTVDWNVELTKVFNNVLTIDRKLIFNIINRKANMSRSIEPMAKMFGLTNVTTTFINEKLWIEPDVFNVDTLVKGSNPVTLSNPINLNNIGASYNCTYSPIYINTNYDLMPGSIANKSTFKLIGDAHNEVDISNYKYMYSTKVLIDPNSTKKEITEEFINKVLKRYPNSYIRSFKVNTKCNVTYTKGTTSETIDVNQDTQTPLFKYKDIPFTFEIDDNGMLYMNENTKKDDLAKNTSYKLEMESLVQETLNGYNDYEIMVDEVSGEAYLIEDQVIPLNQDLKKLVINSYDPTIPLSNGYITIDFNLGFNSCDLSNDPAGADQRVYVQQLHDSNVHFEVQRLVFYKNEGHGGDWNINITPSPLLSHLTFNETTPLITYNGPRFVSSNLFSIEHTLTRCYFKENTLTYKVSGNLNQYSLYIMSDLPFSIETSDCYVSHIHGAFPFDLFKFDDFVSSTKHISFETLLRSTTNNGTILQASNNLFMNFNTAGITDISVSFGNIKFKSLNLDILNSIKNLSKVKDSFNANRFTSIDGKPTGLKYVENSFNNLNIGAGGLTNIFSKCGILNIDNSFNIDPIGSSSNIILPYGILDNKSLSRGVTMNVTNSFRNWITTSKMLTYRNHGDFNLNVSGSFENTILDEFHNVFSDAGRFLLSTETVGLLNHITKWRTYDELIEVIQKTEDEVNGNYYNSTDDMSTMLDGATVLYGAAAYE
ncbi:MAG: hypothetical protein ACRC92_20280 [Peptostreptococcaceae bacterium]